MEQDKVAVAFAVICNEIEATIEELNDEGAQAFRNSRYEEVEKLRLMAEELGVFYQNVRQLHHHWMAKFASDRGTPPAPPPVREQPSTKPLDAELVVEGSGLLGRLAHT